MPQPQSDPVCRLIPIGARPHLLDVDSVSFLERNKFRLKQYVALATSVQFSKDRKRRTGQSTEVANTSMIPAKLPSIESKFRYLHLRAGVFRCPSGHSSQSAPKEKRETVQSRTRTTFRHIPFRVTVSLLCSRPRVGFSSS